MAIYHLSVRGGSRKDGRSAAKKSDYIQRENQYEQQADRAIHRESDNMPEWAQENPRDYWKAADEHERANGRLYLEIEVALPRELEREEQIELAREFARELTRENNLPYTMAVHEGRGRDGSADNPHAHVMISERMNDGIEREKEEWFRRANTKEPERGGARKSDEFHNREHITEVREQWAERVNEALERAQSLERVDHRTLEAQGIDRAPGRHLGPESHAALEKGIETERVKEFRQEHTGVERELRELAQERSELVRQLRELERGLERGREHEGDSGESDQDRGQQRSRGRGMGY